MSQRRYVYVLSAGEGPALMWMALASAASVRLCDPAACIILVEDEATAALFPPRVIEAMDAVFDRHITVKTPYPAGLLASRYLKTSVRQVVDGDLLLLDIDTLMFQAPLSLFAGTHDIGACHDRNLGAWRPRRPEWVKPHYEALGWNFSARGYFNTGVLFMRESTAARHLGTEWHARWAAFVVATRHHQDQPAFNSLIGAADLSVRALPVRFNAMVDAVPFFCWRAYIVHYFLHGARRLSAADSLLHALAERWESTGGFDGGLYSQGRRGHDPWIHPTRSVQIELATGRPIRALALLRDRILGR